MSIETNLNKAFPPAIPFPERLREFQAWAEPHQFAGLGFFEFGAERFDDNWIENGSGLAEQFAFFLKLPDGSHIGFWRPPGALQPPYPVVLLGSEGQTSVLAPDLDRFLWKWAEGETGVYDLDPEEEDEDDDEQTEEKPQDVRPELREWLRQRGVEPSPDGEVTTEDFQQFLDDWQSRQLEGWAKSPLVHHIGATLQRYTSREMEDWMSVTLEVEAQDDGLHINSSPLSVMEKAELLPLLERLREDMAREYPERGLWFSARIGWSKAAGTTVRADYLTIPAGLSREGVEKILKRSPRSAFWLPEGA